MKSTVLNLRQSWATSLINSTSSPTMATIVSILSSVIAIAALTLLERKLLAATQLRCGPNNIGLWGILQPIADGLKLLSKEVQIPHSGYKIIFIAAPIWLLLITLALWTIIPFGHGLIIIDSSWNTILIIIASTGSIHAIAMTGWAAQANYSILGSLRSTSQLISYELVFATLILILFNMSQSTEIQLLSWLQTKQALIQPLLILLPIYIICILAESNRAPFDLPEAEAELVAGFNVEHSGMTFAYLFLAEYNNMIVDRKSVV